MAKKYNKIAILGGGFTGILSIALLKEEGFDNITCFEKSDQIGGTWCYRDDSVIGVPSIMPTTIINHSKEMGAISNFPPRKEFSNYMRHTELYQYIKDYAAAKDVMRHIRLNHQVTSCNRARDYAATGRWSVTVEDTVNGTEFTEEYDAVMMCVGYINHPKMVHFPGLDKFRGKLMHTHSLKWTTEFKDQNVLVIGMGCSALDAAVDISSVSKQVYISTRSGAHVMNRIGQKGYPIDYKFMRRYLTKWLDVLPYWFCGWLARKTLLDPNFNYKLYPVEPKEHLLAKDLVLNDHIFSKLMSGSVIQKRNVTCFTEKGVIFESENEETKVDTVVMGTGYKWQFPFLEEGIVVQEDDGKFNLFNLVWPPHLEHPTFAVIGFFSPFGPGFPLGELQVRYVAQVFSGKVKLPPENDMMEDINRRHSVYEKRYPPSEYRSIKVHFTQFCDELATEIGAKPNFFKLFFTDIQLFMKLVFGPCVPYQYRLEGPHQWHGARNAIMTVDERLHFPLLKGRPRKSSFFKQIIVNCMNWLKRILGLKLD